MTPSVRWSVRSLAVFCLVLLCGCASERAPINRVQPNALEKSFFVGASLTESQDDPEFYYRPTVAEADYGAGTSGLFTASYAQTMARIRWEITEDVLLGRLSYERIEGSTGNGLARTDTGQIAAAFKIEKHFDVQRDYNPQTGEELNVVVENDSDRPWYERQFMRVDWSQNLITSAYELDTLAALRIYSDSPLTYEPVAYQVEDPAHPDAPVFDDKTGYFDVTNKVFVTPQTMETPFGDFPACFFSPDVFAGGYPVVNCNPVELKLRLSFRRVEDRDYQPVDWDGTRMTMFGLFTNERFGYESQYGLTDDRQYRFASRHNIWMRSHAVDADGKVVPCNTQATTPPGADPDRDTDPVTGTADECEAAGSGSRCDKFSHACTLPFRDREVRGTPFYYGPDSDPVLFDSAARALGQWDGAMRHAVQTGRYTECIRTSQRAAAPTPDEIAACGDAYPVSQESAEKAVPQIFAMCHNPVISEDPSICGEPGLRVRVGDLRYHMLNIVMKPEDTSPWGILADAVDPLTGEVVAASVNAYDWRTQLISRGMVDKMRWYLGELSNEDITSGRYLGDYVASGTRDKTARQNSAPLLAESQVLARLAGFDHSLQVGPTAKVRPNMSQMELIDWASEKTRQIFGESALGTGALGAQARLQATRGSPLETQLTTKPYQRLAGLKGAPTATDATLELASPLRGNAAAFHSQMNQLNEELLADRGRCMMAGPDTLSVDDLAPIMAEKFPLPEDPNQSDVFTRNERWFDYLRRHITMGVLEHELGHSMGLRHVFSGSFDALNYSPQYWQLRTRDGAETDYCTDPTDDGAKCIGPRWRDPLTDDERRGLIGRWSHSTVMDYPGDLTQDTLGVGSYDRAALRFAYADVTDVIDDDDVRCTARGSTRVCTEKGQLMSSLIDSNYGGVAGPWYRTDTEFIHYSLLGQRMDLLRGCEQVDTSPPADYDADKDGAYSAVFDGQIVNGTRCQGIPNDYVAYSELEQEQPGFQPSFGAFGGAERKFDALGRVRHPYMFATDNYADHGNVGVFRDDNGSDAFEVANYMISAYEDSHIWNSYRRNRATFSIKRAFMSGYRTYNAKLKELAKGYGLFNEIFSATDLLPLYTEGEQGDALLKPNAIAASMVFDHFTRILTRPDSGAHFTDTGYDPLGRTVFRSTSQQVAVNDPPMNGQVNLVVPDGSTSIGPSLTFGGRPLFNEFDNSKGYYSTQYDAWVGSYYDKTLVTDMLTECADNFVSSSRDDFADGRYRNISFATMFPDGVRRLLGAALTEDQTAIGWRVETNPDSPVLNADLTPTGSMGFRSFWPAAGPQTCWLRSGAVICTEYPTNVPIDEGGPANSLPIDPELGFEVQKFIAFTSLLNLPESWKVDWIDQMRIYRLGTSSSPAWPLAEQATWIDPLSGQTYMAHRQGTEMIDGVSVDRGIGARMIDWLTLLTIQAYQTDPGTDPVTGGLIYPKGPDGQPIVIDQRFVNRLKNYQGLVDFMQEVTGYFGFYAPEWRGVY